MGDAPLADQISQAMYQGICVDQNSGYYDPTDDRCSSTVTQIIGPNPGQTSTYNPGTGLTTPGGTSSALAQCVVQANAATATLDQQVRDLSSNWLPSGYYAPDQITGIVNQVAAVLNAVTQAAQTAIGNAGAGTSEYDVSNMKQALDSVQSALAGAAPFTQGVSQAKASLVQQIDAPGLKRWVTNSLDAASNGANALYTVSCLQPWWLPLFNGIAAVFAAAWRAIKAVAGIALDAAKALLKIPDLVGTLLSLAPWALALGGAYVVYREFVKKKK